MRKATRVRDALRDRRVEMGLSQTDVAKLMDVTPGFYSNLERGVKEPSAETLMLLEEIFGVPASVLMGRDSAKTIPLE